MNVGPLIMGIMLMFLGFNGNPNDLGEMPNTATLVFLTGMVLVGMGLTHD